jgi:hypothetical protein
MENGRISMKPFTLNEDIARDWVTNIIVAHELSDLENSASSEQLGPLPQLDLAWQPREPGQEDVISSLINCAHHQPGVLTRPENAETAIEFVDDGDDWAYRFLLRISAPAPVTLASPTAEVCRLGDDSTWGIDAAIGILREAVQAADALLGQLDAFVAAATRGV